MRFQLVSNLIGGAGHLPSPRSETLVLLGNCLDDGIRKGLAAGARDQWKHVVVVPGPHELNTNAVAICRDLDLIWLNNTVSVLGKTTFVGTPMCPEEVNSYWYDEDVETVQREVRSHGYTPDPCVILSHWRPGPSVLDAIDAWPQRPTPWIRWFYAGKQPLSGFNGRIWECAPYSAEEVYSYV